MVTQIPQEIRLRVAKRAYRWLSESQKARFHVLYGGASSAKSWSMAMYLAVEKFWKLPGVGILIVRKTQPSVAISCWRLMIHWLSELDLLRKCRVNNTSRMIWAPNGSFMQFVGLDDPEKLKSIEGINYVWIEEATEIQEHDLWQLHIRCRGKNPHENNCIFLTFNPVDPIRNQWLRDMTKLAPEGTYLQRPIRVLMLTYKDNPFLAPEERATIEGLVDSDAEYNKIYRLGEWATPTNIIYDNYDVVETFPEIDDYGYGLDFGYANPTAMVWCGVKDETDLYLREVIYETHLHNQDLIDKLPGIGITRNDMIVADSAEPAYIDEIAAAGWNVYPCVKSGGQGNASFVRTGIDRVKRHRIHIHAESVNLIEEIGQYKWRQSKGGDVLDEPLKFRDHALDAVRYYVGSRPEPAVTEVLQIPSWLKRELMNAG